MASPFQPYTGGIQPVQGIQEAGANIAQMNLQAWQGLGRSLSEGLQAYQSGIMQNDAANQRAIMLGQQAQAYLNMYKDMPEYASIAEQLSNYVKDLQDVPNMALGKKLATISETEAGFNQLGQTHALVDKFNAMKTQKAITEAEGQVSPTKTLQQAVELGASKYDLTKSYASQEAQFTSDIDKLIAGGANINKQDAIAGYRQRVQEGATEFSKTNPLGLKISEQIDAARKMDSTKAIQQSYRTPTEEDLKTSPYFKSIIEEINNNISSYQDQYNNSTDENEKKSLLEKINNEKSQIDYFKTKYKINKEGFPLLVGGDREKENLTEQEKLQSIINNPIITGVKETKPVELSEQEKKRLTEIPEQIKALQTKQATGDYVEPSAISQAFKSAVGAIGDADTWITLRDVARGLKNQGKEINEENLTKGLTTGRRIATGITYGTLVPEMLYQGVMPSLTVNEKQKIDSVYDKLKSQNLQQNIKEGSIDPSSAIEQLKQEKTAIEAKAKNAELINQAAQEAGTAPATSTSFALPKATVGTRDVTVPKQQEEIDRQVQDLVEKRLGGNLPSNFKAIYSANRPQVQTVKVNGVDIPLLKQPDGTFKQLEMPKGLSPTEVNFMKASTFGIQDPKTGRTLYETPQEGLDVKIAGTGNFNDIKDANDFRDSLGDYAEMVKAMEKVKEIAAKHPIGTKVPWTVARTDIMYQQAKVFDIVAKMYKLGKLSDNDVKLIQARIPQNESWWRTKEQSIDQANNIIEDIYSVIRRKGESRGLQVLTPSGAGTSVTSQVRDTYHKNQRAKQ